MKIFGKTCAYYKERFGGLTLGVIVFITMICINPQKEDYIEFVKQVPSLGISTFGFLLTFLGIIIQGNSETILWMKSRNNLYNRFISFNKNVILMALYLSALSLILGFVNINTIFQKLNLSCCFANNIIRILMSLLFGCFTNFVYNSINLVKIFFILIKK